MLRVPITIKYDQTRVIGFVELEEKALPNHTHWLLGQKMMLNHDTEEYQIMEFAILDEKEYRPVEEQDAYYNYTPKL